MISNRCARKYLVTNCNSIISKNYLRFLVDSNDAKYKPRYEMSYTGIVPDIREISGYSRDLSILKNFGSDFIVSNKEVRCLIIYPQNAFINLARNENDNMLQELQEMDSMNEFLTTNTSLWNQASPMKYFRNFRKLRIPLPTVV